MSTNPEAVTDGNPGLDVWKPSVEETFAALEAEVPVAPTVLEQYANTALFLFGSIRDGYVWVFPKGDHLSFGIGTLREGRYDLRRRLASAAACLGLDLGPARLRGHALPVYRQREVLQRGRVLLVGDAAGLMDPLSGEGIRHALCSARLASEAILAGDVASYSRRVYEHIGRDRGSRTPLSIINEQIRGDIHALLSIAPAQ